MEACAVCGKEPTCKVPVTNAKDAVVGYILACDEHEVILAHCVVAVELVNNAYTTGTA